ncbi:PEP-CTERM sorting domain-containing protein [Litorilituus lipolyticus]|nr:PEP-CTERM sorting domain-containing protein [Litorilituus lipolyticus]
MKKIFCLLLGFLALSANATLITFDEQNEQYFVNNIVEGDYLFTTNFNGFGTNNDNLWPSNGTMHLMSWINGGNSSGFNLTNTVAGTFSIQSFDFVGGYVRGSNAVTSLSVSGWLDGVLINTFNFTAGVDFQNASNYTTLSTVFSNIDTLQVEAIGSNNRAQFENFIVGDAVSVPEPAGVALIAFGLVGLSLSRRKKKA